MMPDGLEGLPNDKEIGFTEFPTDGPFDLVSLLENSRLVNGFQDALDRVSPDEAGDNQ